MVRLSCACLAAVALAVSSVSGDTFSAASQSTNDSSTIHFLHITDFHIDPFFNPYSDPDSRCHGKSLSQRSPPAYYGIPSSGCDSPLLLVNETLRFVRDELVIDVDTLKKKKKKKKKKRKKREGTGNPDIAFVLWTGDSTRHDRDAKMPKTEIEVFDQNELAIKEMLQTFNPTVTPIIPTIGNWETFPAGDLPALPNDTTLQSLWKLWSPLFPPSPESTLAKQSFLTGGFFARTLLPRSLSAISLNTLSFFNENRDLDGDCAEFNPDALNTRIEAARRRGHRPHPGDTQLVWFEEQLRNARSEGRKIIVIGMYLPSRLKEALIYLIVWTGLRFLWGEFSDVVVTMYFGHINRDIMHLLMARRTQLNPILMKGHTGSSV
ncbi:hypothetical protein BC829DRAFT_73374 [Chytridium lagenaria]|nr:hypothetical protein BC829DRAFT_73374 [Chytridium lagenaria]